MDATHTDVPAAGQARTNRVMVVEDDFLIRLTLSEVLADEGYEVVEAGSGDEAVAVLAETADIDVLLTDIQLPGSLDGLALVAQVRQRRPDLPVIFMTGRPDTRTSQDPRDLFIAKPYLPSEICAAVRELLSRRVG